MIANDMDLPKLSALNDYWQHHPPIHLLLASFVGFKPQATPAQIDAEEAAQELMSAFPKIQG